ncbi:MAG: START domain-containing protein, partial [Waterburya sp.]
KIVTEFDANLSTVVEALLDVPAFPSWIYKIKSGKVLEKPNLMTTKYYNQINLPWPAKDRDLVVLSKVSQNKTSKVVTAEDTNLPTAIPENPDYIRIKDFYAKWVFTPTDKGVHGEYIIHSDPSGDLPETIVNMFVDEGPYNSIKAFKKHLKNPKYHTLNTRGIIN